MMITTVFGLGQHSMLYALYITIMNILLENHKKYFS